MAFARRFTAGDALPAWFAWGLYVALVWCATAGITGLLMLTRHGFWPAWCALIALAAAAAAWPFRPKTREGSHAAHGPALAAVGVALVMLAFAVVSHSEHLFTDRDPSVYINVGRSIARTHRVHPLVAAGPFDDTSVFAPRSVGFAVSGHHLISNFLDFLPALLALGWSAGGDTGLLLVPAVLGAFALLALYALATAVVGPRWALLGPVLLTVAPLQSWFSRDAYSELPVELLTLGGIWLLIRARDDARVVAGAIAGVVVGAIAFVRIDALAILLAIPAALAVEHLRAEEVEQPQRRRRRATIWSFAIALGLTVWVGLKVSRRLSPGYLTNLHSDLHHLELGFVAGIVVAVGILAVHRVHAGIGRRIARNRGFLAAGAAITVALAVYAYHWRPRTGAPPAYSVNSSAAARKAFDAFYLSGAFRWFAWYLGIVTLIFAVIGFIVLGIRAARSDSPAFLLMATAAPTTLLYIARPSVSPDNLWAMRRYLPIVLPAITIAAAAAAICSAGAVGRWRPRLRAPFIALVLAGMLIPTAIAGEPFVGAQMQGAALGAVHEICDAAGAKGAIAIEPAGFLGAELPQTLRGFCGVPAAGFKAESTMALAPLAREWKAAGRQLYVASASPRRVLDLAPNAVQVAHVTVADRREPERTYGRRPRVYKPRPVEVWLFRIDASD